MTNEKLHILNHIQVEQKLQRMAHEILENHYTDQHLVIVGIAKRGYVLAQQLTLILQQISDLKLQLIELEIDKNHPQKSINKAVLEKADLSNKVVILVDDVLNSGKTMAFGIKHLLDFNIKRLCTATLINRKHLQYPVRADYVGLTISTTLKEHVEVILSTSDKAVYLS